MLASNKRKTYDPGRFTHTISFYEQRSHLDSYAGATADEFIVLTTKAVKDFIRDGSQTAIEAGVTLINEDCAFIVRKRNGFIPAKSMLIKEGSNIYVINGVIPINERVDYHKVLCKKLDDYG